MPGTSVTGLISASSPGRKVPQSFTLGKTVSGTNEVHLHRLGIVIGHISSRWDLLSDSGKATAGCIATTTWRLFATCSLANH
jgi:hypothetical protein